MSDFVYYSVGIVALSVCVPKGTEVKQIEKDANNRYPTGIKSKWSVTEDNFKGGESNPCQCDDNEDRLHYLLHC